MTGIERTQCMLARRKADRIALYEHFWNDTHRIWQEKGWALPEESFTDRFGFDMSECWAFNYMADIHFEPVTVEETEETRLVRDGNGALLRRHKLHDTTPEHVDFLVKGRDAWEEHIKPKLTADPDRINFEAYRREKEDCRRKGRFFFWSGVNVFEQMHPVCGHEHMLVGMVEDPDWIRDMVDTYSRLNVELQEILFAREGKPDGIWYYEDMGFLGRPFMSPRMYKELLWPGHKRTVGYAKSLGLPVVMHSCGYVEPLVPGMIEAGVDCLQVIEVKAGMDLIKLYKAFGDRLSFMGGIDVRTLYTNDLAVVDRELESKVPIVKEGFGFTLHSDHSIPNTVDLATFEHYIDYGLKLGTYA